MDRLLAPHDELAPTVLAAEMGVPLSTLSAGPRILSSAGLIRGRRSGRAPFQRHRTRRGTLEQGAQCYYAFTSPYREQTLSGCKSRWSRRLLRRRAENRRRTEEQDNRGLLEVRDYPGGEAKARLHALHATLLEAAIAFTDLRGLQILRYLETRAEAGGGDLVTKLSLSPDAGSRHTAKLRRRGFLALEKKQGRRLVFKLAGQHKTAVHREMHQIVAAAWGK